VVNSITNLSTESGDVSAFVVNATTGALTPVSGSPFAAGEAAFGVAVHPSSRFAYVANQGLNGGTVSAYAVNATTGALTPVPGSPFAADFGSISVALSPNGRFAYVANGAADNVSAYTIDTTTGALTPVPGSPFATGPIPFSVDVSPDGRFAYVANESDPPAGSVSAYTIDATTGALIPVPDSPFAAGRSPTSVTTTAPATSCKHDDEEHDRNEQGDDDEHSEGHEQGDDGHKGHKKHGCHHSGEKDFEEHDNDKMHESERGRF
jgi:DNA-binding beta-propeller fold protein YncE